MNGVEIALRHKKMAGILAGLMLSGSISVPVLAAENPLPVQQQPFQTAKPMIEYKLSKYDVINIAIVGFNDVYFNGGSMLMDSLGQANADSTSTNKTSGFNDIMIGPDGYVNLPYAGSVKLAGLTVPEAASLLTMKMGEYIKIPSMSIIIKQFGPRKVYVMGEVTKQGIYGLSSEYMNVFAAISSAGGITKRGRPKHIAVVRMVDGKVQMQEVNFDKFVEKHDASQNVMLQDGDMVYVPKSNKVDLVEDVMPIVNSIAVFHSLTD